MFDWKDRRVLVTGATGFIGSWLTESLVAGGANVTAFVRDDPLGITPIEHLSNKIKIAHGDVRDKDAVSDALMDQEIVFHLAAITQVPFAIQHPVETFHVNTGGTVNILEQIRKNKGEQILVYASSDKVYGEPIYLPMDEKHLLIGKSPYDASKIAAERFVYAYHKTYGIKSTIARCSNVYGGRDSNLLRAIPDFIVSVLGNKPPVIRGHGEHQRAFIYVSDAVNAYLSVMENFSAANGEAFNFGSNIPFKIKNLAEMIVKMSENKELKPIILAKPSPGEIDVQYLSSEKVSKLFGWQQQVNMEDGLKKTFDWFKNNSSWWTDVMKASYDFYGMGTTYNF